MTRLVTVLRVFRPLWAWRSGRAVPVSVSCAVAGSVASGFVAGVPVPWGQYSWMLVAVVLAWYGHCVALARDMKVRVLERRLYKAHFQFASRVDRPRAMTWLETLNRYLNL